MELAFIKFELPDRNEILININQLVSVTENKKIGTLSIQTVKDKHTVAGNLETFEKLLKNLKK